MHVRIGVVIAERGWLHIFYAALLLLLLLLQNMISSG